LPADNRGVRLFQSVDEVEVGQDAQERVDGEGAVALKILTPWMAEDRVVYLRTGEKADLYLLSPSE
jgi:hypothetical protein